MRAVKLLFPFVLLAASGAAIAAAEGERAMKTPSFEALDTDGDGAVTREEAMAAPGLEESFEQLDADVDGVLSPDEIGVGGPGAEATRNLK